MSVNYNIYSNGNASSKTIVVDFGADFLASSSNGVSTTNRYFFKFTTSARKEDNTAFNVKISEGLNDLVLNEEKQRMSNTGVDYTDIKSMVVDYLYDFVHGHVVDLHASGVTAQLPMKFN